MEGYNTAQQITNFLILLLKIKPSFNMLKDGFFVLNYEFKNNK